MTPRIIFEDENLLVLDKPSGWIVNEAVTTKEQPTLQAWIKENFNFPLAKNREFRSDIVHRLDKETSGVILIAKTREMFEYLQRQFKERKIQKTYLALTHGEVEPKKGVIKATVGRLPWRRDRFGVLPGGREAETGYEAQRYLEKEKEKLSLLVLHPKTGRTHQIRIHLKYIGHPIVGDVAYAGRKTARKDRKWCPRMFLHASEIELRSPDGKKLSFSSPLPQKLEACLFHEDSLH